MTRRSVFRRLLALCFAPLGKWLPGPKTYSHGIVIGHPGRLWSVHDGRPYEMYCSPQLIEELNAMYPEAGDA